MTIRKFSDTACELEQLNDTTIMKAYNSAKKGDLKPLKEMYRSGYVFGHEHLIKGSYRLYGWSFNLSEFCKTYLVKEKYYGWTEYKTPNKTCLYNIIGRHNVLEIIEK